MSVFAFLSINVIIYKILGNIESAILLGIHFITIEHGMDCIWLLLVLSAAVSHNSLI